MGQTTPVITEEEEHELYLMLKELPDFDCMPIPVSWFKKYNIPARKAVNPREFIESGYTLQKMVERKDLPPIIIDEPQQDGKLIQVPEVEELKLETITRQLDWDPSTPFPAVLPSIKEESTDALKSHDETSQA